MGHGPASSAGAAAAGAGVSVRGAGAGARAGARAGAIIPGWEKAGFDSCVGEVYYANKRRPGRTTFQHPKVSRILKHGRFKTLTTQSCRFYS